MPVTLQGYLETYYQLHAQNPENHVTNLRGFDNRSRTFALSNVALDVKAEQGAATVRFVLQVGDTPATYYVLEPDYQYVQTATVALRAPHAITVEAGLFLSPIGPEVIPVKDNMNWSRSNLFYGLPFYHAGARVSKPLGGDWTGTFAVYNGWNSVVDTNTTPSIAVSAAYATKQTTAQLLYFGGNERASGAPEGSPWRHLLDVLVQHAVTDELTLAAQLDAGVEPNDFGTSAWAAGAAYAKYALTDDLYVAGRGDYFYERVADGASAIFWPTPWIASGTATLAYQPTTGVSIRFEVRHDQADSDVFFGGDVAIDPMTMTAVPDRHTQDTATLGVTAWF